MERGGRRGGRRGGGERWEERGRREGGEEVERGGRRGGEEAGRRTAEGLVSLQGGSIATTDDEGPVASPRTSLGAVHCL